MSRRALSITKSVARPVNHVRAGLNSQFHSFSSSAAAVTLPIDPDGPTGELFSPSYWMGDVQVGQRGRIQRVFGPRDTAQVMLLTGGPSLAGNASFDPNYDRAQSWIRQHAVGPAALTPALIPGLVGALVEAAFPRAVVMQQELRHVRPLIVGLAVQAEIEVAEIVPSDENSNPLMEGEEGMYGPGHMVLLNTQVTRVRDDACVAHGKHTIWIPDYNNM
ncbi:hypothetical protein FisN_11Hh029 [Fistulifera solaris]|uniref:Uncharacterized protein n=1 Tax=Fistulifera solaris TaxID=1519565 RepID=A0A1Z5JL54_FISSO|nr:hypothetical protein FisN_11Hh029 [Fistulifera solaris]|eukprot:GAX14508.1 hypothetical protein FisN_11Hh029 [Fistulifera solaris]